MNNLATKEPAVTATVATAIVGAIIGLLAAFGVGVDQAQRDAILQVIALVWPFVSVGVGFIIRSKVTPTAKANQAIDAAYVADPATTPKPTLKS